MRVMVIWEADIDVTVVPRQTISAGISVFALHMSMMGGHRAKPV